MNNPDNNDQERRKAAQELLRQILGPSKNDLTIGPTAEWALGDNRRIGKDRAIVNRGLTTTKSKDISPEVEAAFSLTANDYPVAAGGIGHVGDYPDEPASKDPGRTLGIYRPGWGSTFIRNKLDGKSIDFRELVETIKHELSHAMGASDAFHYSLSGPTKDKIGAYDISEAADILHKDVNLPYEGSAAEKRGDPKMKTVNYDKIMSWFKPKEKK